MKFAYVYDKKICILTYYLYNFKEELIMYELYLN